MRGLRGLAFWIHTRRCRRLLGDLLGSWRVHALLLTGWFIDDTEAQVNNLLATRPPGPLSLPTGRAGPAATRRIAANSAKISEAFGCKHTFRFTGEVQWTGFLSRRRPHTRSHLTPSRSH